MSEVSLEQGADLILEELGEAIERLDDVFAKMQARAANATTQELLFLARLSVRTLRTQRAQAKSLHDLAGRRG